MSGKFKTVLLAGMSPEDLARCYDVLGKRVSIIVTGDAQGALSLLRRNPEIAVVNIDCLGGKAFLKQVKEGTAFTGKLIVATNERKRPGEAHDLSLVAFREVPDVLERALHRLQQAMTQQVA
ncbi:MAG: hypothetical protein ACYCZ7_00420 [Minisyncoccota bacterium]